VPFPARDFTRLEARSLGPRPPQTPSMESRPETDDSLGAAQVQLEEVALERVPSLSPLGICQLLTDSN